MEADAIVADLYTPQARHDPNPWYAKLHELGPASPLDPATSVYSVVANGFDAVADVLRGPRFLKGIGPKDKLHHPVLATLSRSMMFSLEPDHGRMRGLFNKVFTPRRIAGLENDLIGAIDGLLDRMAELGAGGEPVDFIAEFGYQFPTKVIGLLLHLPESDLGWFRERAERIDRYLDLGGKTDDKLSSADDAVNELTEYYLKLIDDRRRDPGDDIISHLVGLIDSGSDRITDIELVANLVVLLNASFVTTMNLLGNGLLPLLARPDLVDRVRADADFASRCVEEILRYDSPVQLLSRIAGEDTGLAGVPIAEGADVLVLIGAANRDPRKHADPGTFDPDRADLGHQSFGGGAYFCLGAALSRLEGRLAFPRLFQRFPDLAVAGEPTRGDGFLLRGYSVIPVTTGGHGAA
ncbi:cytochrome P450 [Actinophytocola sp. NPDC049390]|uniref:cytochrome P450 n=1 Tax=Actinophytocola sp. NPDC049390 TaxID=3363894 RepID=UPI00379FA1CC